MRILTIANFFPPHYVGGAELSAFNTCLGLMERGVEVSALMVHARLAQRTDVRHEVRGVQVHEVNFVVPPVKSAYLEIYDPRVYRTVVAEIERVKPDLVHVHNVSGASLSPFVACRRMGVPVVLTLHDHWLLCPNNMLYQGAGVLCNSAEDPRGCSRCFRRYEYWGGVPRRRQILKRLVRDVRLFVSPSQMLVDRHVAAGYDPSRFRVIRYGIHPTAFEAPSDPFIQEQVRESTYMNAVLYAGGLVESKGIDTLIEAVPLMAPYVDRLGLFVAGWGEAKYVAALRKQSPWMVRHLGRVPFQEMRRLYASVGLTVVPSWWYDNSPMVIYESLLAGTPVLGANIGGIPELILDEETGYIIPAGDAGALAEKVILHFARSALRRRRMRQRCLEYAQSHLSMDRHLDAMQAVYAEATGDTRAGSGS
jgi:glycosyltransferase involved in cell wall biosynthesis